MCTLRAPAQLLVRLNTAAPCPPTYPVPPHQVGTISEAYPHLIFDRFSSKLGQRGGCTSSRCVATACWRCGCALWTHGKCREASGQDVTCPCLRLRPCAVSSILKYLFPPPKHDSKRVITFANQASATGAEVQLTGIGDLSFARLLMGPPARASWAADSQPPNPRHIRFEAVAVRLQLSPTPHLRTAYRWPHQLTHIRTSPFPLQSDFISFRHHTYEMPKGAKSIQLKECGPRFEMKLYQVSREGGAYSGLSALRLYS